MSHDHGSSAADIEMLDLDGKVLAAYWADVHDLVQAAAPSRVRRVLDLGSGSGNGALGFAYRFPDAEVIAVDTDEAMLAHIAHKAKKRGVAERVRTTHANLDEGFPAVADVDVAWASLSLHHFADPDRVLADLHSAMHPGAVLAVAEMTEPLRFLPAGSTDADLETRCLATMSTMLEHDLPHLGSDWSARLTAAGFTVSDEHTLDIDLPPTPQANRYAWLWFDRLRGGLGDRLTDADRGALDALVDDDGPAGLAHRPDLHIRGTRTVVLARA